MINAPKGYFRLSPGISVRLKSAYKVTCNDYKLDDKGNVEEIYCTYHPASRSGGEDTSGVNVKTTIHWVNTSDAVPVELRLYDRLFNDEAPDSYKDRDFMEFLNPASLTVFNGFAEKSISNAKLDDKFQFLRMGYFTLDKDSGDGKLIFNRTVTLKDAWAKVKGK
jgi:glutaminyl-tRNA synthetase